MVDASATRTTPEVFSGLNTNSPVWAKVCDSKTIHNNIVSLVAFIELTLKPTSSKPAELIRYNSVKILLRTILAKLMKISVFTEPDDSIVSTKKSVKVNQSQARWT
jgi:hypothetical protein